MKKSTFLTVACMLFCAACSSDDEVTFPCTFTGGELVPKYETRVYTVGGRRLEGPEVQEFLDRTYRSDAILPDDPLSADTGLGRFREPESWIESFRFDDAHTINTLDGTDPLELRRRGEVILAGREVPFHTATFDYFCYTPVEVRQVPFSDYGWVPFAVIRGGYLSPHFSMVALKVVRGGENNRSIYTGIHYNEFDKSVLEMLTENDTLAVREYYVRFPR